MTENIGQELFIAILHLKKQKIKSKHWRAYLLKNTYTELRSQKQNIEQVFSLLI